MTEHRFFPPLAEKPGYMDDVKDMDNGDDMEIYPGVFASRALVAEQAEKEKTMQAALKELEQVRPIVRQVTKQVVHDSYKPCEKMEQAARIFTALYDGVLEADYLEPNNKRISRLCDGLLDGDIAAKRLLFLAAMEYGYKLAEQQTGAKKAVE